MIRLHFDVDTGMWLIQMLKFGMFWMTVQNQAFDNHDDACAYITSKGLNKVYFVQSPPRDTAYANIQYGTGAR